MVFKSSLLSFGSYELGLHSPVACHDLDFLCFAESCHKVGQIHIFQILISLFPDLLLSFTVPLKYTASPSVQPSSTLLKKTLMSEFGNVLGNKHL